MTVLDASALVALVDRGHPRHQDARDKLATGVVTVGWGALAETATVLRRLARNEGLDGAAVARSALRAIQSLRGFREAPAVDLTEVTRVYEAEPTLSFFDAWNLVIALHLRQPLLSYDGGLLAAHRRLSRR
jgi:predicted nucleic acid-binding protein